MAKARILSSHTYDEDEADRIVNDIYDVYSDKLSELVDYLTEKKNISKDEVL
jgi:hypothetical protein